MPNLDYMCSVDLESPMAMVKMDITDRQFPSNYFDCVICYHVLEHIPDDQRAMEEIFRALKPGGWAILQVSILRDKTFEDPNVTTPEDRGKNLWAVYHVRIYGLDYKNRLEQAGLSVKADDYVIQLSDDVIRKHGLMKDENILFLLQTKFPEGK